jgi:hypothetical protein
VRLIYIVKRSHIYIIHSWLHLFQMMVPQSELSSELQSGTKRKKAMKQSSNGRMTGMTMMSTTISPCNWGKSWRATCRRISICSLAFWRLLPLSAKLLLLSVFTWYTFNQNREPSSFAVGFDPFNTICPACRAQ